MVIIAVTSIAHVTRYSSAITLMWIEMSILFNPRVIILGIIDGCMPTMSAVSPVFRRCCCADTATVALQGT